MEPQWTLARKRKPNRLEVKTTGLLLADQGELEQKIAITKKLLVNWLRQIEGGIPEDIAEMWDKCAAYTGNARGPVNYFRREI
eukprot:2214296-Heterocapsa_arctica.AAC.1